MCPGVPGTVQEQGRGDSMRLACQRFGGRLNRFWRVIPRFPAHYILMQDIRCRCSARLGLHHLCPYCLTLPARANSMARRLLLCPPRWRRRSPYIWAVLPRYRAMGSATFSGLVLSAMRWPIVCLYRPATLEEGEMPYCGPVGLAVTTFPTGSTSVENTPSPPTKTRDKISVIPVCTASAW